MNTPLNIYIEILKYGRLKLNDGVMLHDLVEYLNKNGFFFYPTQPVSIHSSALINVFLSSFQDRYGNNISNMEEVKRGVDNYYLKTEALAYLLSIESLEQAKEDSKNARKEAKQAIDEAKKAYWFAVFSFIISLIISLVSIFK